VIVIPRCTALSTDYPPIIHSNVHSPAEKSSVIFAVLNPQADAGARGRLLACPCPPGNSTGYPLMLLEQQQSSNVAKRSRASGAIAQRDASLGRAGQAAVVS
jgi:hypothetical protein